MKTDNPILLFRNVEADNIEAVSFTYNLHTGLHAFAGTDSQQSLFTNSMQTKSREAIDTIEYSEL